MTKMQYSRKQELRWTVANSEFQSGLFD